MKVITVAAAVIVNELNQILLVRKKNTQCFMQVGGKLEKNEAPEMALLREVAEEIGVEGVIESFIGRYETATANEPDHRLISYVYHLDVKAQPQIMAEIEEMVWLDVSQITQIPLAPLTQEIVIPWVKQHFLN